MPVTKKRETRANTNAKICRITSTMADEAFITAVPHASSLKSKKKIKHATEKDILEHVRHDHTRIMHVVKEFGAKVSTMYVYARARVHTGAILFRSPPPFSSFRVDKQRAEYIQAYESHMQDVQKELFLLREKVHILDTDETRALKMKQLQDEQDRLKAESVQLDEQNDVTRQKLRALTISMQVLPPSSFVLMRYAAAHAHFYHKRRWNGTAIGCWSGCRKPKKRTRDWSGGSQRKRRGWGWTKWKARTC